MGTSGQLALQGLLWEQSGTLGPQALPLPQGSTSCFPVFLQCLSMAELSPLPGAPLPDITVLWPHYHLCSNFCIWESFPPLKNFKLYFITLLIERQI